MKTWFMPLALLAAVGLAFVAGQRVQSQSPQSKDSAGYCADCGKGECPQCAKGNCPQCAKHGHGHHGKHWKGYHEFEYKCVETSTKGKAATRAKDKTAQFNRLGSEGWRLAGNEGSSGAVWCFMRHKRPTQ